MSVILETSLGDIVIDLYVDQCPKATRNFLKLCKIKYYNNVLFHSVEKDFIAQTGDPTGSGKGGVSIYEHLYGAQSKYFTHEIVPSLTHASRGTVGFIPLSDDLKTPSNGSMFYITLRDQLDFLDGKYTIFGQVAEGFEVLDQLNEVFVRDDVPIGIKEQQDAFRRPLKNIKIRHTIILDDPFDDPGALEIPDKSPEVDWDPLDIDFLEESTDEVDEEKKIEILKEKEAFGRAQVLEIVSRAKLFFAH